MDKEPITKEEMNALRAFQMVKGRLTSFASFFGAGVEYGEGVQREKDIKICKEIRQNIAPGNKHYRNNDTYKIGYLEACEDAEVSIRKQGED